ncbi:MAG: corrinoid protein [Desulfohalobiaceae bacterium]|nr:corrinoid protein [Desulfohalobiaceae bacterium]
MADMQKISDTLIAGKIEDLKKLVQQAIDEGTGASEILGKALMPGMDVVGERMENGDMFIPEVLMSAKAMSGTLEILKPLLTPEESKSAGKVVIGTVKGDLHDIGKNLVAMMLESAGYEVVNLGVDIAPENFVEAVKKHEAQIVALSALLTTTMPQMQKTIAALKESGLKDQVKIIVGGAPVTEKYAKEIGAEGYAPDAGSASKLVKSLMQ